MEMTEEPRPLEDAARALIEGLSREHKSIEALKKHVEAQLKALHNQERELIEETTQHASQEVNRLQKLRNKRAEALQKLTPLLGLESPDVPLADVITALQSELGDHELTKALDSLSTTIPGDALATRERCKELAYSLQYALHLGHELIGSIQGATVPPPVQVYTADGHKKLPTSRRMMVNKVG